jgi:hypothetical protein
MSHHQPLSVFGASL